MTKKQLMNAIVPSAALTTQLFRNKVYMQFVRETRRQITKRVKEGELNDKSFNSLPIQLMKELCMYAISDGTKYKLTLDPDADGDQWLYRKMSIIKQDHPKLLKYACYDNTRNSHFIDVSNTMQGAKKVIDKYLKK